MATIEQTVHCCRFWYANEASVEDPSHPPLCPQASLCNVIWAKLQYKWVRADHTTDSIEHSQTNFPSDALTRVLPKLTPVVSSLWNLGTWLGGSEKPGTFEKHFHKIKQKEEFQLMTSQINATLRTDNTDDLHTEECSWAEITRYNISLSIRHINIKPLHLCKHSRVISLHKEKDGAVAMLLVWQSTHHSLDALAVQRSGHISPSR